MRWMTAWKRMFAADQTEPILLQETHIASAKERDAVQRLRCTVWDVAADQRAQWSFWSVHTARTGGVAILLHPHTNGTFRQVDQDILSEICVAVESDMVKQVNIYAPTRDDGGS